MDTRLEGREDARPLAEEVSAHSSADRGSTEKQPVGEPWGLTEHPVSLGLVCSLKSPLRVLPPHLGFSLLFLLQSSRKSSELCR